MLHRDVAPWLKVGVYMLGFVAWSAMYFLATNDWRILVISASLTLAYAAFLWQWNSELIKEETRRASEMLRAVKEEGKPDADLTK